MRVGLDIGSTTIKCVVLDEHDPLLYSTYERHYSHILEKAQELLCRIDAEQLHGQKALLSIPVRRAWVWPTAAGMPFVQEVFATRWRSAVLSPTDVVIELGGEDAKILFLDGKARRSAHERLLRGRHRRVHRPDGHAAEHDPTR